MSPSNNKNGSCFMLVQPSAVIDLYLPVKMAIERVDILSTEMSLLMFTFFPTVRHPEMV